jgi:hypothetical protein
MLSRSRQIDSLTAHVKDWSSLLMMICSYTKQTDCSGDSLDQYFSNDSHTGRFMPYYKCFPNLLISSSSLEVCAKLSLGLSVSVDLFTVRNSVPVVSVPSYQDWYFGGLVLLQYQQLDSKFSSHPPKTSLVSFEKTLSFPYLVFCKALIYRG